MSKTPSKTTETLSHFNPRDLVSPNKDTSAVAKTVFTHVSNIHSLLSKWFKLTDKGTKIVKSISSLKLHECYDDYYPHQLTPLTEELLEATNALKDVVDSLKILHKQLQVLVNLHPIKTPVINTWPVSQISTYVSDLYSSLCKEFKLKKIITENIAHCRDEKLIEIYASAWEHNVYINLDLIAYLFVEVGLSSISLDTK